MSTTLRTFHDQLLALRPEEAAEHVASECPVCSEETEVASLNNPGGPVSDSKTYSEAEYNEVAGRVADLEAKVAELSAAAEADEVDAKVAAVQAEAEAQVADLQSRLDAATLEAATAKEAHEALVNELTELEEAKAAEIAFEATKAERIAAVKEAAPALPEEFLSENADRFAKMDEEAFQASLDSFKEITAKAPVAPKSEIPATTAMTAARSNDGDTTNPLRDVLDMRFVGVDTRTIN